LEDGSRPLRALETDPSANPGGWIAGEYCVPTPLCAGDRIEARVGFLQGVAADATFSLQVESGGQVVGLASRYDTTDGALQTMSADLSPTPARRCASLAG